MRIRTDFISAALNHAQDNDDGETLECCEIKLGDLAMCQAVDKALNDGDTSAIVALVRAGVELGCDGREELARWIEGKYRRGKGRPRNVARKLVWARAEIAARALHRERSLGGTRLTLLEACDEVAATYGVLPEQLREYVRRSKQQKMPSFMADDI